MSSALTEVERKSLVDALQRLLQVAARIEAGGPNDALIHEAEQIRGRIALIKQWRAAGSA